MNVSSIGSGCAMASIARGQNEGASSAQGSDANVAVGRGHGHGHHGGGLRDALMQALEGLGVNLPQPTDGATPSAAAGAAGAGLQGADPDGDGDRHGSGAGGAAGGVRQDMHAFMHELFSALRAESSSGKAGATDSSGATATGSSGSAGGVAPSLSSDFSALVSDIGNGKVPAGLQQAFDRLMADFASAAPSTSTSADGSATGGTTTSASGSPPTLQQLLTAMQQDLGYGPGGKAGAMSSGMSGSLGIGNSVSVSA